MIEMKKYLMDFEEGKKEFLTECKIRNLASDTIDYYTDGYNFFLKFINQETSIKVLQNINKGTIESYIMYMREQELEDTTINIRLRAIRRIMYFFMENDYIDSFKIKLIKEEEKVPNLYTDEEIMKLIKKPNVKECNFAEFRTWAITNFFIATGVRSRTLRNVRIKDLDFNNDLIWLFKNKNRKQFAVPMGYTIKKVLREYLKVRGGNDEDYAFCNVEGEQLTRYALSNVVSSYNRKRGVNKTGIHLYRHYFSKAYIQNGGNALKLQKLLGHSTLQETQRYVDLFGKDLQKDFDKFSPLDNIYRKKERIKMR